MVRSSKTSEINWEQHLEGPKSTLHYLKGMRKVGGPMAHHRNWLTHSGVSNKKPQVHEHFTIMATLEAMGSYDQVNIPALMSAEILVRRAQLIESAFDMAADKNSPDFSHTGVIMGLSESSSGSIFDPNLKKHVASELRDQAAIQKELRKAAEGRTPKTTVPYAKKIAKPGTGDG